MTTEVKEQPILSEEELAQRKAIDYLKGCIVGYITENDGKYESSKEQREDFKKGFEKHRYAGSGWITVCHIIHNRLRHNRPHTGSYESDQEFLTDFSGERWENSFAVRELKKILSDYNLTIPGLED